MRALITVPLFALLSSVSLEDLTIPNDISGAMKQAKTRKCHTPDKPIVTIGYILHGFNFTSGDKPDPEFHDWQSQVLKKATVWLQSYYVNILLEDTTVAEATKKQSAEIEKWMKKNGLVYPPAILEYLKEDVKNNTTHRTDIVCLVTKVPLTLYEFGFGSYEPLCDDVVPVFLTYKKTWVNDVGDLLGQVILNSIKMNNYNEWYKMSKEERNHYFKNCIAQRFAEDYF
uniref:Putative ixodes 26 kDa salivary protein n=1 Tax=Ixodes ricinus TaxID=34613 RepID=A0A0K8R7R0_IXORI